MGIITSLGFMMIINAIFDTLILFLRFSHHRRGPLFGKDLHWTRNTLHAILVAGPALEFLGAYLIWLVYTDMRTYDLPAFDHERQNLVGRESLERSANTL